MGPARNFKSLKSARRLKGEKSVCPDLQVYHLTARHRLFPFPVSTSPSVRNFSPTAGGRDNQDGAVRSSAADFLGGRKGASPLGDAFCSIIILERLQGRRLMDSDCIQLLCVL